MSAVLIGELLVGRDVRRDRRSRSWPAIPSRSRSRASACSSPRSASRCGVFDVAILSALVGRYLGTMTNETLVAVPLFVFMGVMLERSKIAEALLTTMGELFGSLRGGLGYSVVIVGALLAASTGIVGATVVTMGLLSLPAMMRAGYDRSSRPARSARRARSGRSSRRPPC